MQVIIFVADNAMYCKNWTYWRLESVGETPCRQNRIVGTVWSEGVRGVNKKPVGVP